MSLPLRAALTALFISAPLFAADPPAKRIAALLTPDQTDLAALSPDGRHLAYTVRVKDNLDLVVATVDSPAVSKRVRIGGSSTIGTAISPMLQFPDRRQSQVLRLRWPTDHQLVYLVEDASRAAQRGLPLVALRSLDIVTGKEIVLGNGDPYSELGNPVYASPNLSTLGWRVLSEAEVSGPYHEVRVGPVIPIPHAGQFDLLGFRTDDPQLAVVEVRPFRSSHTTLYQVDIGTGRATPASEFDTDSVYKLVYDQQFRPRFTRNSLNPPDTGIGFGDGYYDYRGPLDDHWFNLRATLGFGGQSQRLSQNAAQTFPLGFDRNPDILYIASNAGRVTYGVYAFSVSLRTRTGVSIEDPVFDQGNVGSPLLRNQDLMVYDRDHRLVGLGVRGLRSGTLWLEPKLAGWQERLDRLFPGRNVRIRDWSTDYSRVLAENASPSDSGTLLVLEAGDPVRTKTTIPRSPSERAAAGSPAKVFSFVSEEGRHLTGSIIMPAGIAAPPLLLYCHDIPESTDRPALDAFNPELQALAALGYAVAEVNYSGSSGLGFQHLGAGTRDLDSLAALDLHRAAAWLSARFEFAKDRMGLIGFGFGGYIALRAAQLFPAEFRAVVAVQAPGSPKDWIASMAENHYYIWDPEFFGGKTAGFTDLRATADQIRAQVALVQEPGERMLPRVPDSEVTGLRSALRRAGRAPNWLELSRPFRMGTPEERAAVFVKIGGFLDSSLAAPKPAR